MNNIISPSPSISLKRALLKWYEAIPISVYLFFLVGFIINGGSLFAFVFLTLIGCALIFVGITRILDNKTKIIINSHGVKFLDEDVFIEWNNIENISIEVKKVKKFDILSSSSYSTTNVECIVIITKDKKRISKIIEQYSYNVKKIFLVINHFHDK